MFGAKIAAFTVLAATLLSLHPGQRDGDDVNEDDESRGNKKNDIKKYNMFGTAHAYSIAVEQIANRKWKDRPRKWNDDDQIYDAERARTTLTSNEEYDLLVIGGGKTGCAVSLDAASRGWRVCLVEEEDFGANGHGLALPLMSLYGHNERFKSLWQVVRNAATLKREARERIHFFRVAPHLMREMPCLHATYSLWQRVALRTRIFVAHNIVGLGDDVRSPVSLNKVNVDGQVPYIPDMLHVNGAITWNEAGFDEMRMITSMALTAAGLGATIVNHHRVESFTHDEQGKVTGANVRDMLNGEMHHVKSRSIVNATGIRADELRRMDDPNCPPIISHILRQQAFITLHHRHSHYRIALFNRYNIGNISRDALAACMAPWESRVVQVATSPDLVYTTNNMSNKPTEEQIKTLLNTLRENFKYPLYRLDVLSSWLHTSYAVDSKAMKRKIPARDSCIDISESNLLTAVGAKWPTVRSAAEEIVNAVGNEILSKSNEDNGDDKTPLVPSNTSSVILYGSNNFYHKLYSLLHRGHGLSSETAVHLKLNYGDRSEDIARIMFDDPRLSRTLSKYLPVTEAEIVFVTQNECVKTAIDVIARRTRMVYINREETLAVLDRVVQIMAPILGWDELRKQRELKQARDYIQLNTA